MAEHFNLGVYELENGNWAWRFTKTVNGKRVDIPSALVNVGDVVSRGQAIGTAGQTGFTGANGAHIAMSVGESFVSPYDTWSDSPVAAKVIIPYIDG